MWRFILRRLGWSVVLFVAVTFVTYVIFFIIPVNPAAMVAGKNAGPEDIERAKHFLGLDDPIPVQYVKFLNRLLPFGKEEIGPGDYGGWGFKEPSLGRSFQSRRPVNDIVLAAAPVSASLALGGFVILFLIAFPLGILSALKPRSLLDRSGMVFVLVGVSAHPVWIGLLMAFFFGYKLAWTPIAEYCDLIDPSTACGGPVQWAYHLLLPWVAFGVLGAAIYVRMIRAEVLETMSEDYVRTARAKGAPESVVIRSHVLRNAMLPVVTMFGMDLPFALNGVVFLEIVFGLPGLGQIALESVTGFDLPITQGIVVFTAVLVIVFTLLVDILYAVIDPRIRLA
ncbi:MAG: ABC transporter permease [Gaiellaceae bacterium]